ARAALLVGALDPELHRPKGPRGLGRALFGRFRQQFELVNRERFLAVRSAEAICAGIPAADDNHSLAGRQYGAFFRDDVALAAPVLLRQEFHREVDAFQLAARNLEIARPFCAAGQQQRVVFPAEFINRNVYAYVSIRDEAHTLGLHLTQPAVDEALLHLEIRDSVAEQSADA